MATNLIIFQLEGEIGWSVERKDLYHGHERGQLWDGECSHEVTGFLFTQRNKKRVIFPLQLIQLFGKFHYWKFFFTLNFFQPNFCPPSLFAILTFLSLSVSPPSLLTLHILLAPLSCNGHHYSVAQVRYPYGNLDSFILLTYPHSVSTTIINCLPSKSFSLMASPFLLSLPCLGLQRILRALFWSSCRPILTIFIF